MKFEELAILLPCHSLEDFPLYHEGKEADGLLAAWTALWHPRLLADARSVPQWYRADDPPQTVAGRLFILPEASAPLLQAGWTARAESEGARVVSKLTNREAIVAAALADRDGSDGMLSDEIVGDFHALGFCYLQVELLTRQMRYMSNLDEVHFSREVLAAADAAVAGDSAKTSDHLRSCFDILMEARERFYSVDTYILDLTLVATTTLGAGLSGELSGSLPINLMASGNVIAQLAHQHPETLATLRQRLEADTLGLIGGEFEERELPLFAPESILAELKRGRECYQEHLGRSPSVFGRRRYGLTPALPQILHRLEFIAALHFTLDDGQFPRVEHSKTRWEGDDGSAIDAFARVPFDASRPESFLNLPEKLGETMDSDQVATIAFAHWPGQTSVWYEDLRRICAYAPVLGRFITVEEYFQQTDTAGHLTKFEADRYRAPYLKQAVNRRHPAPLSECKRRHNQRALAETQQTLRTMAALVEGTATESVTKSIEAVDRRDEVNAGLAEPSDVSEHTRGEEAFETELARGASDALHRFAQALPRSKEPDRDGYLVVNPLSFSRSVGIEVPELESLPDAGGTVKARQQDAGRKRVVVEVPAMGFSWIEAGSGSIRPATSKKPMVEDNVMRNEHMEVTVDPATGGIRSIHDFKHRANRLSQQLAFRLSSEAHREPGAMWRNPDDDAVYSVMVADAVEVTSPGPALAEITCRGRLVDRQGERLAGYEQKIQLWRRSPTLILDITLEVDEEPRADPWNSYYASRFAWSNEGVDLRRSVNLAGKATDAKRLEAPHFIEIRNGSIRTTILSGGLPYHRRVGYRMLDTLLVTGGEQERRFRLGIGVDLDHPLQQALELNSPIEVIGQRSAPPVSGSSGWLFHLDARNVVATHWEPILEDGRVTGVLLRLIETEGRAGRIRLDCYRNVAAARQTDFLGQMLIDLSVEESLVLVDVTAYEYLQLEILWPES